MKHPTIQVEDLFYLLSDKTRLRCLFLLKERGELCVCGFTYALKMIQPKVSRHLAIMRKFNLLLGHRKGVWVYYKINPELPMWIHEMLSITKEHISISKPYSSDIIRINNFQKPSCR